MTSLKPYNRYLQSSEETPLLRNGSPALSTAYNGIQVCVSVNNEDSPRVPLTFSQHLSRGFTSRLALAVLCTTILTILCVVFFIPVAASQYANEAMILDLSSLSIEGFTDKGLSARIQARVSVNAGRVENGLVQTLGKLGTWMVRRVSSEPSTVLVYLPDYDNGLLGTATAPAMLLEIRNGQTTSIDFISEVQIRSPATVRGVANDYLQGDLGSVRVRVEATLGLKVGIFDLGMHTISEELVLEEIPSLPNFQINRLSFGEIALQEHKAIQANASITVQNTYPLKFEVPTLSLNILLPGCNEGGLVLVATARTSPLDVKPKSDIGVEISSVIQNLPGNFITACPASEISPIDRFIATYLHGDNNTIFVRGSDSSNSAIPTWVQEILRGVTIHVPFPGHTFKDAVKSFNLSNVNFHLPSPDAKPGSPESSPRLGALVVAKVKTPEEINIMLDVKRVRAMANVSYEGENFGVLDLRRWMAARSSRSRDNKYLEVCAEVQGAPMEITDYGIFSKMVREMSGKDYLKLGIRGSTDVEVKTSIGGFIISAIPVIGNIAIDRLPGFGSIPSPKAHKITVEQTTPQSITLRIDLTIRNPTPWAASVPYINLQITHNGTVFGNASVHNTHILPGNNLLTVSAIWDPRSYGGSKAEKLGAKFFGEYVSGQNTSLTVRPHVGSLPSLPLLSRLLSNFEVTIPTPRFGSSHDFDNEPPHFIESATIHIRSSTADFVIENPLQNTPITIYKINGTAKYNRHDLGTILYEWPFEIMPSKQGKTLTPKLPVDWGPDNVGYGVIKKALRGQLKVRAEALCWIGIGDFSVEIFYNGSKPIGTHVGF